MGVLAGELDEALLAERAARGPEAVAVADADLPPLAVGVTRRAVALPRAVALRLLLGPGAQREHLLAEGALGDVDERALVVVRGALADAVQAGVVGAALEHGVRRVDLGVGLRDGLDQPRDVALHELVLEGQRGRRDHDALVVEEGRDEVGEGLAGAGAGLHDEVSATVERVADGLGHRHLTGALLAPQRRHRRRQYLSRGWTGVGHWCTLSATGDNGFRRDFALGRAHPFARGAANDPSGPSGCPDPCRPRKGSTA